MFSFVLVALIYWLFSATWFVVVQKPLFGIYNRRCSSAPIRRRDITAVYSHGFVTDAIVASYMAAVPLIIGLVSTMLPVMDSGVPLMVYNIIMALAIGLLTVADTALYPFWKFKIDSSVFVYLHSLKGATASVSGMYILVAVACWIALSALFFVCAQAVCCFSSGFMPDGWMSWCGYIVAFSVFLVAVAVLFVIIRGVGVRPNNPSIAYFSGNAFFNHWALNPGYSIIYSLSAKDEFKGRFRTMPQEESDAIVSGLFPTSGNPEMELFTTDRPNVLLVIWESLGAEFTGLLNGDKAATPNLDAMAREGIMFSNCSAGSFRTDRGLVCLLSGYLAQPTTSVIRYTRKLPHLPGLPRLLKAYGYTTVAIHGGDLSIMHKSDYYLACGHDRLIGQKDLPSGLPSCKWGVHDGPVMDFVGDEIERLTCEGKEPFFITLQTLSSHEPFDVPENIIPDKIRNAYAYTDKSLGRLVARLKKTPAWRNLLIAVVADHSLNLPQSVTDRRRHAHIPLVIGGGAVKASVKFDCLMSQTDFAATLLGQLGIKHSDFLFSRDVTADSYTEPFGLHVFPNGVMLADDSGKTVIDTMSGEIMEGDADPQRVKRIKAILQKIYEDLDKR